MRRARRLRNPLPATKRLTKGRELQQQIAIRRGDLSQNSLKLRGARDSTLTRKEEKGAYTERRQTVENRAWLHMIFAPWRPTKPFKEKVGGSVSLDVVVEKKRAREVPCCAISGPPILWVEIGENGRLPPNIADVNYARKRRGISRV